MRKLLTDYTTPETGYKVFGYPFGRQIKCVQLYWVETAVKGAKKNQQRLVSCTTHVSANRAYTDKIATEGAEAANAWISSLIDLRKVPWNAPKAGIYYDMVLMCLGDIGDGRMGVTYDAVSYNYTQPEKFDALRSEFIGQMTEEQQKRFSMLEMLSRRCDPDSWAKRDAARDAVVESALT